MKVEYRGHKTGLVRGYLLALLFGGSVTPENLNMNQVGDVCRFDEASLRLVVEEGRRQIDNQDARFRHTTDRAQIVLTVGLALLGFLAAQVAHSAHVHGGRLAAFWVLWSLAGLVAILGTGSAAAVVAVKAVFSQVDTTIATSWRPPILQQLARDYAKAVRTGETTVAARVSLFRIATRLTIWAGLLAAVAFGLSA